MMLEDLDPALAWGVLFFVAAFGAGFELGNIRMDRQAHLVVLGIVLVLGAILFGMCMLGNPVPLP